MKSSTMKTVFLSMFLATVLVITSVSGVQAQTPSIAGDGVCGATAADVCTPADLKEIGRKVLTMFALLGSGILVVIIGIRLVRSMFAYMRGDVMAIKKAGEAAFNALIGFFIVFAVAGGIFLLGLKYLGAQPWVGQLLQMFSSVFVETAYAQETLLPNPLGSNSAYDLILAAMNLAMRFFIYPALIVMWVASGFKFIYSQGNPEGLKTARDWLLWSFVITVVAFSLQAFLLAFRATAEKIVPIEKSQTTPAPQTTSPLPTNTNTPVACGSIASEKQRDACFAAQAGTADGRGKPEPKTPGAACVVGNMNGQWVGDSLNGYCVAPGSR